MSVSVCSTYGLIAGGLFTVTEIPHMCSVNEWMTPALALKHIPLIPKCYYTQPARKKITFIFSLVYIFNQYSIGHTSSPPLIGLKMDLTPHLCNLCNGMSSLSPQRLEGNGSNWGCNDLVLVTRLLLSVLSFSWVPSKRLIHLFSFAPASNLPHMFPPAVCCRPVEKHRQGFVSFSAYKSHLFENPQSCAAFFSLTCVSCKI